MNENIIKQIDESVIHNKSQIANIKNTIADLTLKLKYYEGRTDEANEIKNMLEAKL